MTQNDAPQQPARRGRPRNGKPQQTVPRDEEPLWAIQTTILEPEQRLSDEELRIQRTILMSCLETLEELKEIFGDNQCTFCQIYAATRIAVPCFHRLCRSGCAVRLLSIRERYDDGSAKPITCAKCRALIGSLQRFY